MEILTASTDLSATDVLLTTRFVGHGIVEVIEAWLLTTERAPRVLARGNL